MRYVVLYKRGVSFKANISVITLGTMKAFTDAGWNIVEYINE